MEKELEAGRSLGAREGAGLDAGARLRGEKKSLQDTQSSVNPLAMHVINFELVFRNPSLERV